MADSKGKSSSKTSKSNSKGQKNGLLEFLADSRTRTVTGVFLLILSAFLTLSFISHLVDAGINDQSQLQELGDTLVNPEEKVDNWMGKLGAIVAEKFIHSWFGISSFLLPFILLLIGFKVMFRKALLPIGRSIKHSLFFLYFIPLAMGYLFAENANLSGSLGFQLNRWTGSLIGSAGTAMLLIFLAVVYLAVVFNMSIDGLKSLLSKVQSEPEAPKVDEEGFTAVADITVKTNELDLTKTEEPEPELEAEIEEQEPEPVVETTSSEMEEKQSPSLEPEGDDNVKFEIEQTEIEEETVDDIDRSDMGEYDPTLDLSHYKKPGLDLLESYGKGQISVDQEELETNKNKIVSTLRNYNIEIDRIKATIGPTVTLYEIVPAPGIRISKIKNLEDDIALSLSALGIRIIAPIPGKGTIGIEVPNQNPDTVSMKAVLSSEKFQHSKMELPIALGKTISNETYVTDLTKMPHLLMAGATGQGKSVGLNCILASILYKKHPAQVKFVLVDPKKVELTLFNKIERHFLAKLPDSEEAIITDTQKVVNTVNSLCLEMDNRYELLKNAQCRNLKEYNAKFIARRLNPKEGHKYLPYIVLVIDEFADLIMTAGKEIETPIARLAQLARAIGIHLIVATQRPSVNIITGTIKANFPARIAFRVTSKIDSRTILDAGGADQLIGRGDMLLSTGNDMVRIQCAFIDTPEVEKVTDYIGSQQAYPTTYELPEYVAEGGGDGGDYDIGDRDPLFEDAARIVVQHQQGSASLLQRRLKLGYNRAGRLVDQLEAAGIIGPHEGSKARQVLITDEMSLEQKLQNES
ncbi:MAG: DNA translocase FtsK 4TM domain-containing protein [Flavobacteriales bacterium]|nr:DNA translocase FtsK 4TM domain-containing protein [Flavobacteriales bacterium]MCB9191604.1 DNA translocase FtsK 4TM domain-containing protein [Flavobacteriales bacterium]